MKVNPLSFITILRSMLPPNAMNELDNVHAVDYRRILPNDHA